MLQLANEHGCYRLAALQVPAVSARNSSLPGCQSSLFHCVSSGAVPTSEKEAPRCRQTCRGARHAQETKPKATERNWIGRQCFRARMRKGQAEKKRCVQRGQWRGAVAPDSAATLLLLYQTGRVALWLPHIGALPTYAGPAESKGPGGGEGGLVERRGDRTEGCGGHSLKHMLAAESSKTGKQVQHCRAGDAWLVSIW